MESKKQASLQEMLDAIYEKIADKTLSFGCKCWVNEPDMPGKMIYIGTEKIETLFQKKYVEAFWCESEKKILYERYKIIGHPVMIGDVMNYLEKFSKHKIIDVGYLIRHWMIKTMPIEEQSSDCIKYVYDLIK